jgi:RNA polymerase sigma-70 factor, ECF subfamily
MLDESDDDLIAATASGDEAAFNRLVRRHADRAHAIARRYLGSAAEADDVVQDAFWRAWNGAARWRTGEAAFSTWLHRVVVNLCIDRTRRARIRKWLPFDAAPEPRDEAIGAEDGVMARAELRAVLADLGELPERQRAALLLSAEGERANAEIAAVLSVSEKAVESLLVRARRTLRARLAARQEE